MLDDRTRRLFAELTVFVGLLVSASAFAENKFVGTGSCASSGCHGSSAPKGSTSILQNEYRIWHKHDRHSKAWLSLTTSEARKIAANLELGAPEKEPSCLACHSTAAAVAGNYSSKFSVQDGVGCESCHGAAEKYLAPHAARDRSRERNLQLGMRDITGPEKRADLCLGCHYGGQGEVNHRLIGAGHPRLAFELDTFGAVQPPHWVVDEDYVARKGRYDPVKAWLVGQIELSSKMLDHMVSSSSRRGNRLELSDFHCYSCHHSLTEKQWRKRSYGGKPGQLRLNLAPLVMVGQALKVMEPSLASKFAAHLSSFEAGYFSGDAGPAAKNLKQILNAAGGAAARREFDLDMIKKLASDVARFGANSRYPQYELAEQTAMALSSILSAIPPQKESKRALSRIYNALGDPARFIPESFNLACADLVRALR